MVFSPTLSLRQVHAWKSKPWFKQFRSSLSLTTIKIATDSSFLVDAMSQWIDKWIEAGGVGSRGKKVTHYEVLKQVHEKLDYMNYSDQGGRHVQFWHIPRDMNREADLLANRALDGI
jgi:ribonuclease HI